MDGLPPQGLQDLLQKALPVHVAAGLGEALRRPLLRAQEEVVQVKSGQPSASESRAPSVDFPLAQQPSMATIPPSGT